MDGNCFAHVQSLINFFPRLLVLAVGWRTFFSGGFSVGGVDVGAAGRPGVWGVGCVVGWVWGGGTREGGKEKAGELVIVMILSVVMLWAR